MTILAKKRGLLGFTATVLFENRAMLHLFEKLDVDIEKRFSSGMFELVMVFK